jgi:hypothetical protein
MFEYGGTSEEVKKQLKCSHDWHGPCLDEISRYYKCRKCFCLMRDMSEEEFVSERNEMAQATTCTVVIKPDGHDGFEAEDSETNSTGCGKTYPDALIDLAREMAKVGEGCLMIMEDWARAELERAGKEDEIRKAELKDAITMICDHCEGRDGNREACDCPVWRIQEQIK